MAVHKLLPKAQLQHERLVDLPKLKELVVFFFKIYFAKNFMHQNSLVNSREFILL
jgi:hypothetical protein